MLKAEFMQWLFRFGIIKLRLQLSYYEQQFKTWDKKATSTPLKLWKYANFTKPVFCPFPNHWINFWIVVRVLRAQLGLICVRRILVWPEQCEFLHRMDVDAIFQQINLRYEWAISVSAILTLNRMDVDMIFFSFNYSSSLSTSESRVTTPLPDSFECFFDPQRSFGNPLRTFWQYLANFSAIPREPCSYKIEIFSGTVKFSSLIGGHL